MERGVGKMRRVILIVLDSMGIGALPDATEFGDDGADTFGHIYNQCGLHIPNLLSLGIGKIPGVGFSTPATTCIGCYGKADEITKAKDTISGHWEMAGYIMERPFRTYTAFPDEIITKVESAIGRKCIGNVKASGTEIIHALGDEHAKAGNPIVYTSADSVFQVAAHENILGLEELYRICGICRELLTEDYGVGRVVARPYVGVSGGYTRTKNRRDYATQPQGDTILDVIDAKGDGVYAIGKIGDIFCHRGIAQGNHTTNNAESLNAIIDILDHEKFSLVFANLIDMDMLYGHRNDKAGYAKSIKQFDIALGVILGKLRQDDVLIVTADHGCDPAIPGTDHTREYIPILLYSKNLKQNVNLGIRRSFADIGATVMEYLEISPWSVGESFLPMCINR